ncbi:MAG: hypothetical protein MJA29_08025, partial [Candidatus Omnitrophica bacterium]|nr:hypothetical protein [Candidatus Omnitrophota bacterium]
TTFIYTEERLKYDGNIYTHALRQTNPINTRRNILMVVSVGIFRFRFQGQKMHLWKSASHCRERKQPDSDYSAPN